MEDKMLSFTVGCLEAIADVLSSEPCVYIVGFILAGCIIKILREFLEVKKI